MSGSHHKLSADLLPPSERSAGDSGGFPAADGSLGFGGGPLTLLDPKALCSSANVVIPKEEELEETEEKLEDSKGASVTTPHAGAVEYHPFVCPGERAEKVVQPVNSSCGTEKEEPLDNGASAHIPDASLAPLIGPCCKTGRDEDDGVRTTAGTTDDAALSSCSYSASATRESFGSCASLAVLPSPGSNRSETVVPPLSSLSCVEGAPVQPDPHDQRSCERHQHHHVFSTSQSCLEDSTSEMSHLTSLSTVPVLQETAAVPVLSFPEASRLNDSALAGEPDTRSAGGVGDPLSVGDSSSSLYYAMLGGEPGGHVASVFQHQQQQQPPPQGHHQVSSRGSLSQDEPGNRRRHAGGTGLEPSQLLLPQLASEGGGHDSQPVSVTSGTGGAFHCRHSSHGAGGSGSGGTSSGYALTSPHLAHHQHLHPLTTTAVNTTAVHHPVLHQGSSAHRHSVPAVPHQIQQPQQQQLHQQQHHHPQPQHLQHSTHHPSHHQHHHPHHQHVPHQALYAQGASPVTAVNSGYPSPLLGPSPHTSVQGSSNNGLQHDPSHHHRQATPSPVTQQQQQQHTGHSHLQHLSPHPSPHQRSPRPLPGPMHHHHHPHQHTPVSAVLQQPQQQHHQQQSIHPQFAQPPPPQLLTSIQSGTPDGFGGPPPPALTSPSTGQPLGAHPHHPHLHSQYPGPMGPGSAAALYATAASPRLQCALPTLRGAVGAPASTYHHPHHHPHHQHHHIHPGASNSGARCYIVDGATPPPHLGDESLPTFLNAAAAPNRLPAHKPVRLSQPKHPLAPPGTPVYFKYGEEHYPEETVPPEYTFTEMDGTVCRYITNFLVYNKRGERLLPIEVLDQPRHAALVLYGSLLPAAAMSQNACRSGRRDGELETEASGGTVLRGKKRAAAGGNVGGGSVKRHHLGGGGAGAGASGNGTGGGGANVGGISQTYPVRVELAEWCIDYGQEPSNVPFIWLISRWDVYYRLEKPAGRYIPTFATAKMKFEVSTRVIKTLQHRPTTEYKVLVDLLTAATRLERSQRRAERRALRKRERHAQRHQRRLMLLHDRELQKAQQALPTDTGSFQKKDCGGLGGPIKASESDDECLGSSGYIGGKLGDSGGRSLVIGTAGGAGSLCSSSSSPVGASSSSNNNGPLGTGSKYESEEDEADNDARQTRPGTGVSSVGSGRLGSLSEECLQQTQQLLHATSCAGDTGPSQTHQHAAAAAAAAHFLHHPHHNQLHLHTLHHGGVGSVLDGGVEGSSSAGVGSGSGLTGCDTTSQGSGVVSTLNFSNPSSASSALSSSSTSPIDTSHLGSGSGGMALPPTKKKNRNWRIQSLSTPQGTGVVVTDKEGRPQAVTPWGAPYAVDGFKESMLLGLAEFLESQLRNFMEGVGGLVGDGTGGGGCPNLLNTSFMRTLRERTALRMETLQLMEAKRRALEVAKSLAEAAGGGGGGGGGAGSGLRGSGPPSQGHNGHVAGTPSVPSLDHQHLTATSAPPSLPHLHPHHPAAQRMQASHYVPAHLHPSTHSGVGRPGPGGGPVALIGNDLVAVGHTGSHQSVVGDHGVPPQPGAPAGYGSYTIANLRNGGPAAGAVRPGPSFFHTETAGLSLAHPHAGLQQHHSCSPYFMTAGPGAAGPPAPSPHAPPALLPSAGCSGGGSAGGTSMMTAGDGISALENEIRHLQQLLKDSDDSDLEEEEDEDDDDDDDDDDEDDASGGDEEDEDGGAEDGDDAHHQRHHHHHSKQQQQQQQQQEQQKQGNNTGETSDTHSHGRRDTTTFLRTGLFWM